MKRIKSPVFLLSDGCSNHANSVEFNLLLPHYPNYRIAYVYSGETITRRCFLLSMGRRFQQPAAGIT